MARVTAAQWLTDWGTGLNGAAAKIKRGVAAVTIAPGQAAAAKEQKMLTNTQAAITSGKWSRNVSAVSLSQWQDAMSNKGTANIASGVAQAQKTKQAAITKMLADTDAAVAQIQSMPTDTMEQRIAKATAYMRARAAIAEKG